VIARLERVVNVRRLAGEERLTIEATEPERAALAEALDLLAIRSLVADVALRPWCGEGVRVTGTVRGAVTQACVVTLEPVEGTVEEPFDVRLHPDVAESTEIDLDPDAADAPEPMESDAVDVGAIALEHFVLGIDPYPRVPGVAFEPDAEEAEASPFAALAALKKTTD
jgi:uncharacterized metal-binding protein YceD (DUF177 family)